MFKLLSAGAFACAIVFEVWGDVNTTWNWVLLMLIGFLCYVLSDITGK
jgi:hypothetical protein